MNHMLSSQSQKDNIVQLHLYEISRVVKFIDRSRTVVDRGWWIEEWGISALMGTEFQFGNIKISADG